MAYWLLKTEPTAYAWNDLERDRTTVWDGVNNALALKHIRTINPGDLALFYHTGKERKAVGIIEVTSAAYPDPKLDNPKALVFDIKLVQALPDPVTLEQIKQDSRFINFDLLKISRLSVVPVSAEHWSYLLELGKVP